jgi:hypothetical protein
MTTIRIQMTDRSFVTTYLAWRHGLSGIEWLNYFWSYS